MKFCLQLVIVNFIGTGLFTATVSSHNDEHGDEQKRVLIQDNYYTIMSKLEALTQKVDTLTAHNNNLQDREVAFFSKLTSAVNGVSRYVHYDDVVFNIGNGYNPNHGVFVAPVNGTYQFSLYACANAANVVILDLFVNQTKQGTLLAGDSSYTNCNSEVFLLQLVAGDDVYVKTGTYDTSSMFIGTQYGLPTLSGVLLRAHS